MTFDEWVNKVIESGKLCDNYTNKAIDAKSKIDWNVRPIDKGFLVAFLAFDFITRV